MMLCKVVHVVTNDYTSDSRVFRAATVSASLGFSTIVYCLHRRNKGLPDEECHQSINVRRFRLTSLNWPRNFAIQLIKYSEAVVRMVIGSMSLKPGLVYSNDLSGLIIGYLISKVNGSKLIYDSHELLSQSRGMLEYPKIAQKIILYIEKRLAKSADAVITVSDGISKVMSSKLSILKPHVIRNLPCKNISTNFNNNPLRDALDIPIDSKTILYQGGMGKGRGLPLLVQAVTTLNDANAVLVFLGNGVMVNKLKQQVKALQLEKRVLFHPAVDTDILPEWTADATLGVHPMEGICLNHKLALPNKIFEYIKASLPIIVTNLPEMANIIRKYKVGLVFEDGNALDLSKKLNIIINDDKLLNTYKINSQKASNILTWDIEQEKLLNIFTSLTTANTR